MSHRNILILIFSFVVSHANAQNTAELYSLPGLTIASNITDDISQVFRFTDFYIKDTIIDNKEYFEYQNKNCNPTYLRIDGFKVYEKNLFWNEDETLLYDFGLEVGDSLIVPVNIQIHGWMRINFRVRSKEIVVFLDGRDRIKLELEADFWGRMEVVEGVGIFDYQENIECIKDDSGSIYLAISEEECNQVTCKNMSADYEIEREDSKVTLTNRSVNYDELEWDLGDGNISSSEVVEHKYLDKGCWTISLTARNRCGDTARKIENFSYCVDSLWVQQSERYFEGLSMVSESEGFAITKYDIYKTIDSGASWSPLSVDFLFDSVPYMLTDIKMNKNYGVIMIGNSNVETDILLTSDRGMTWTEIAIPELDSKWRNRASIDVDGNIVVSSSNRNFTSTDEGITWESVFLENGGGPSDITLYQGNEGLVVISSSRLSNGIDISTIHISTDYGRTFSHSIFEGISTIPGISYTDGSIYLLGRGIIKKTKDLGATWDDLSAPIDIESPRDIHFSDQDNGLLITSRNTYRTIDGGQSWSSENCENILGLVSLEVTEDLELIRHSQGVSRYLPDDNYECLSSLAEPDSKNIPKLYPNPSLDKIYIEGLDKGIKSAYCINMYGKHVPIKLDPQYILNVSPLPSGLYILIIEDEAGQTSVFKFMKQ